MLFSKTTFIWLNVVAIDALIFKKELLLQKPIVCLQAFYGLKYFEQTDLYQSVLKML